MTSELLADYEEGTFTPVVAGLTTAGTGTYSQQLGKYTKIGRIVYFTIYLDWSAHTGTGNASITGFPYTSAASYYSPASIAASSYTYTGTTLSCAVVPSATTMYLYNQSSGSALSLVTLDTSAYLLISGTYST